MIRPHAKLQPKRTVGWCDIGHLVRRQLLGSAQNDQTPFLNGFPAVRGANTLHMVESYYDPTTCKVSLLNMGL
jgi:hypothetical protein